MLLLHPTQLLTLTSYHPLSPCEYKSNDHCGSSVISPVPLRPQVAQLVIAAPYISGEWGEANYQWQRKHAKNLGKGGGG